VSEAPTPALSGLSRHAQAALLPSPGPCLAYKQAFEVSERRAPLSYETKASGGLTTRWSRPGQPGVDFGAILDLAGRVGSSRGRWAARRARFAGPLGGDKADAT